MDKCIIFFYKKSVLFLLFLLLISCVTIVACVINDQPQPVPSAPVYQDVARELPVAEPTPEPMIQAEQEPKQAGEIFTVTAYDLSVESCGKPIGHPHYGLTATGFNLTGMAWHTAKTIAVDPDIIPLGSKVLIRFLDEKAKQYNGIYVARDTGGAIKGNRIDFFLGDYSDNHASEIAINFGVKKAEIIILSQS